MDSTKTMILSVFIGIAMIAALVSWAIPEPSQRAVVTMDRLDVVVLPFANSSSWPSAADTVEARTEARLVQASGIDVYSRGELDALFGDQVLDRLGFLDPETAERIGALIGVARLIGGTVYSVQLTEEETTVCEAWADGKCVTSVPAIDRSVRILAQIEVVDATTGRIEAVVDSNGEAAITTRRAEPFSGYDVLVAAAADEIAADVASTLIDTYTRGLRYGLYQDVEEKRDGFVGHRESSRFRSADDTASANLVIHYTRVKDDDEMTVLWLDEEMRAIQEDADVVSQGEWRLYRLGLAGLEQGRYTVVGVLNGVEAFVKPFIVEP